MRPIYYVVAAAVALLISGAMGAGLEPSSLPVIVGEQFDVPGDDPHDLPSPIYC
jgi:hypothetical protein